MDAAVHGNHYGIGRHQEQEERTPSDVSERPSVDDVESDTGSTGALETRSLKDHKGNGASVHVQQSSHWKYLLLIKTLGNILFFWKIQKSASVPQFFLTYSTFIGKCSYCPLEASVLHVALSLVHKSNLNCKSLCKSLSGMSNWSIL